MLLSGRGIVGSDSVHSGGTVAEAGLGRHGGHEASVGRDAFRIACSVRRLCAKAERHRSVSKAAETVGQALRIIWYVRATGSISGHGALA